MRRFCALVSVVPAVTLAASDSSASLAAEVDQLSFHYVLRSEPSNPGSPVLFTVSFFLTPLDFEGENTVGWYVDRVRFKQYNSVGGLIGTWKLENPTLDTHDGLWWVTHQNWEEPLLSEFSLPPEISDTAISEGSGSPLHVYFEGAPPEERFNGLNCTIKGVFDYRFDFDGKTTPEAQGLKEPGDIIGPHDDTGDFSAEPRGAFQHLPCQAAAADWSPGDPVR